MSDFFLCARLYFAAANSSWFRPSNEDRDPLRRLIDGLWSEAERSALSSDSIANSSSQTCKVLCRHGLVLL